MPAPTPAPTSVDQRALAVLMVGVQRGEQTAFRELYGLTHGRVFQSINRVTRAPDHSAEVLQEVYLHAWLHAGTFDPARGTVLGWLSMLGHRRAVDRVRQVVRMLARDHQGAWHDDVADDASVLGLARHDAAAVQAFVARLSDRQRQAVSLTYLDGLSYAEAADHLGIPLSTLKTRVRDGVCSLRRALGVVV